VITAWSALSPFGFGHRPFVDGVSAAKPTVAPLDRQLWSGPATTACLVPDFAVKDVLGRKGTRSMDRVTGLAVSAVRSVLNDAEGNRVVETGTDTALVLGTTMGSAQSAMEFTRDSLTGDLPYHVDPARMPNTVMNCAAGQCAIRHQLRGPNTTLAGGATAGLLALDYARRLLDHNRARKVLVAAAEEYSSARAWLHHHSGGTSVLGEGCAVFLVEPLAGISEGREPLAEVLAIGSRVYLDEDPRATLELLVRGALSTVSVAPGDVWAASGSMTGIYGDYEQAILRQMFGHDAVQRLPSTDLLGDTGAASSVLRIATVLSVAERVPEAAGKLVVVTAVDSHGVAACTLFRLAG
jgi:3-oxoacyl-[acyl-carrier-protein] synthase II